MRLSQLKTGQEAVITKILGHGAFRKRVMEMGFVRGRRVTVLLHAPLRDPIKYSIMGYEVSLRRSEADLVEVEPMDASGDGKAQAVTMGSGHGAVAEEDDNGACDTTGERRSRHTINIALIGNPNCGKTSLFNNLTGAREHVGNYSGVTVDAKSGQMKFAGYTLNVVDLPGTYSLASYSPEELYVRKYLREETPDIIINVVDASNLERNLYLTTELVDMDRSMVIALNMYDDMLRQGSKLDYNLLGDMIGVPIVPTVSKTGQGIKHLLQTVIDVFEERHTTVKHVHVMLDPDFESALRVIKDELKQDGDIAHSISPRYMAIKLLEGDLEMEKVVMNTANGPKIIADRDRLVAKLQQQSDQDVAETIAAEKYGFIAGALAETLEVSKEKKVSTTARIDRLVTNRFIGFPLFLVVMFLTFWLTFAAGQYPMDWMQAGVDWLSAWVSTTFPDGMLKDLIADGVIGGVGGVIVFLPNILILYFCISFMEDTGYMARAAFIMDRVMHKLGLHGKSFIPMVMGFGCNVPAIMASRTIESRSSRIITVLINSFMSCSARVPIYVLLVGTFFSAHSALTIMALYLLGILVAVVTARMLRKFWFKRDVTPFVMELPPYRLPGLKTSLRHMWNKGEQYLKKMTGLILLASVIVWALNYFPRNNDDLQAENGVEQAMEVSDSPKISDHDSYLARAGKAIAPVMEPAGFTWRSTVSALAGLPSKEIVVSTLGVLYTGDEAATDASLSKRLTEPDALTGKPDFDRASALAFMVFILLFCPCTATLVAIAKETGSWRYSLFSAVYNTSVAWLLATLTYQLARLF